MQSKPAKTHFIDLALQGGEMGREDCQRGWHQFFDLLLHGKVLDVGAGLGQSKKRIRDCTTQDPQPSAWIDITTPVENILDNSFDTVTAFDVIEHVVEDVDFLRHLCRIAKKGVFFTTPNEMVSKAANGCHCREYGPMELDGLIYAAFGRFPAVMYFQGAGDGSWILPLPRERMVQDRVMPHLAAYIFLEKE